jgi:hypothetical protein
VLDRLARARKTMWRTLRNNELAWRWLFNGRSALLHRRHTPALAGEAARVLADLDRDGVALTSVSALLPERSVYDELLRDARALDLHASDAVEKDFNRMLLGEGNLVLDPGSVYARFALQSPLLEIINAYFGMWTRLRYYNVWHTDVTVGPPKQSQLWHRDREDRLILKCFVYLSDVDDGAGPFTYARGTHPKGEVPIVEAFDEDGVQRSTDEQMERVVPRERWLSAQGAAGTIVIADTRGYHKGGLARRQPRLMYNCMWTSPTSGSREWFDAPPAAPREPDPMRARALAPKPHGRSDWWR